MNLNNMDNTSKTTIMRTLARNVVVIEQRDGNNNITHSSSNQYMPHQNNKKVTMTTFEITPLCFVIVGIEVDTYYLMKVICSTLFDGLDLEKGGKEISIQFLC
jgi:hypothetical protein